MNLLNWFWSFWNQFSNLVRFRDTIDSISCSKESTSCSQHDVAIGIHKISSLDTPIQILTRGKDLGEHFCQTNCCQSNEYEIDWLLLISLTKWEKKLMNWGLEFPAQALHKWPKIFYVCPEGHLYLLRLLTIKPSISSSEWLNYSAGWIPSLTACLLLK